MILWEKEAITIDFFNGDQLKLKVNVTIYHDIFGVLRNYLTEDVKSVSGMNSAIGNNHYVHGLRIPLSGK